MKKTAIILSIALALILLFIGFSFFAFHDYPQAIVATSSNADSNNQYFLNGTLVGDSNGFCVTLRDEKQTEIKLVNSSREQSALLTNKFRFSISEPSGDNLGLEIIRANANQELRTKFGCGY